MSGYTQQLSYCSLNILLLRELETDRLVNFITHFITSYVFYCYFNVTFPYMDPLVLNNIYYH